MEQRYWHTLWRSWREVKVLGLRPPLCNVFGYGKLLRFFASLRMTGLKGSESLKLAHKAEVGACAEIIEVGEDGFDLTVGQAHPFCERSGVLLDRCSWDETACAHVVGLIGAYDGVRSVHITALNGSACDDVVASPAMVGAVAVCSECAAEVRCSEGGHAVAHTCCGHDGVEVLKR